MHAWLIAALVALPSVMPLTGVEPGQKGECRTVFEGDKIEPFPFVVKGIMRGFLGPRKDLVLVRLLGDKTEFTGVVSGMSGSPCTINGKLVGALAYAFGMFAKEPIAGITPMQSMLDVMKLPEEKLPWRIGDRDALSADWEAMRRGEPSVLAAKTHLHGDLRPIATPLGMGGVVPAVRTHFDPWLRSVGFEPVAGGISGGVREADVGTLRPGSAVAAVLVRGDVEIAATGTVTAVEGNTVLAFGHPFFGAGAVSIPMASSSIINTMVTQMRSYKMALVGATLGEITQDRLTAIGGYLGQRAKMIPVHGKVRASGREETYKFEIARDLELSPRFTAVALANAFEGRVSASARGTVRVDAEIKVEGIEPVRLRETYSGQRDASLPVYAAIDVGRYVATLWNTPFGPPPNMEVSVAASFDPEPIAEWIEALHVDRGTVRPGESLSLAVRLRRDDGPLHYERFTIAVPNAWAGQEVEIFAASADVAQRLEREVGGDPRPTELAQIGRWLTKRRADGHVYVIAVRPGAGMTANVRTLSHLPPSVVATMSGDPSKQRLEAGLAWEERRERPGVVLGYKKSVVKVRSR